MDWEKIVTQIRQIREHFDRCYKCLNTYRPSSEDTIDKHFKNLFVYLEQIRVLVNVNYDKFTAGHKCAAEAFYSDIRNKLLKRRGVTVEIPDIHHRQIECI